MARIFPQVLKKSYKFWLLAALLWAGLFLFSGSGNLFAAENGAERQYIVLLADEPLATYDGGLPGLAATAPAGTGSNRLDATSMAAQAYRRYLAGRQAQVIDRLDRFLGRPAHVHHQYDAVLNGFTVSLNAREASVVATLPGVTRVVPDEDRYLLTDVGPAWIGASGIWDGSATGGMPGTMGAGVVVGVIDTGINHDHPSFADPSPGDGYDHSNPRGQFYGVCDPVTGLPFCNDKLIGLYDFTGSSPLDDNGHGSHTASTAAGNVIDAALIAPTTTINRTISGVAPHANIIAYKACVTTPAIGTCPISALIAAINQATLDGVDVINFSIGGGSSDPWSDLDAQAFFSARSAGIFVATSAGNDGPGAATVGSPADAPWVMSVAASTHNRRFVNALVNMSGGNTPPPADIAGKSVTAGYGPAPIVYAGDYGNALCADGTAEAPVNPFPPDTFQGEIVVCDRGTYARVDKARFVGEAGAGGFVLANDAANGDSLVGDPYAIPGVHIGHADGQALKAWMSTGSGHLATITGTTADESPANGDVMASFSSRGPNPATGDIIKPDITAPGVDILAAFHTPAGSTSNDPEFGVISGTSMSSPHIAGSAALVRALHPDWTPDEVKSALMTTAFDTLPGNGSEAHIVYKEDGVTPADPFDMGAGRADLAVAGRAGLVLDETPANYNAANPANGGDPRTLNLPSLADGACTDNCSWTRTVRSSASGTVTWNATTTAPGLMSLSVTPATFTLAPGATQAIIVQADASALEAGWHFARVTLVPNDPALPRAHLPVAVLTDGTLPPRLTLHFQGNLDEGCTGSGAEDLILCDGPFLVDDPVLDDNPAAQWGPVTPAVDGTADRNIYDPNWIWNLSEPTTVAGPMTVEFWASCAGCGAGVSSADWEISLWADGVQSYAQRVTATPELPHVPSALAATIILPETTANSNFVLQIDPVYLDSQQDSIVYYDATGACPGAAAGPCDSVVHMPVVGLEPPNTPPEAVDDSATVERGSQVDIAVLANDSDADDDPLAIAAFTQGQNGQVTDNGDGSLHYAHDGSATTADSFTYTIADGNGGEDSATVWVTITDSPPPAGDGQSTGGGWLATTNGSKLNFGFNVQNANGQTSGDLQLNDQSGAVKIHINEITAFGPAGPDCNMSGGNAVEFQGNGTFNGAAGAGFRICAQDNGEPGRDNDAFFLECTTGCGAGYDTRQRTADNIIAGGNLQVHHDGATEHNGSKSSGNNPQNSSAATLILDPLLLTEGPAGQWQLFSVRVYDTNQALLANAEITLTRIAADGTTETFTALSNIDGVALFNLVNLNSVTEYIAAANGVQSNGIAVTPLLP